MIRLNTVTAPMEAIYKIIGGDGLEYGPVSLAELKAWICDGRVVGQTPVWGSPAALWQPAVQYSELQPEIGRVTPVSAAAAPADRLEAVGFWPRLGAYLIDGLVLYLLFFAAWGSLSKMMNWHEPDYQRLKFKTLSEAVLILAPVLKEMLVQTAVFYVWKIIYDTSLNGRFGATVGKMIIGARIVRLDDSRIGYGTAFVRSLGTIVSDMIFYAGYLFVAFRDDKRALHDLLAGTRVVFSR